MQRKKDDTLENFKRIAEGFLSTYELMWQNRNYFYRDAKVRCQKYELSFLYGPFFKMNEIKFALNFRLINRATTYRYDETRL